MRAYLIDADRQTISEIDFIGNYKKIQKILSCSSITTGSRPLNGSLMDGFDAVYVSDDSSKRDRQVPSRTFCWE